ncbi:outer membrane beta-barrel protein [Sphingobacterium sp. N143]|uniref:outer membrane beta-barrel protein n=1 Tax=Sphingobacterium sp. N143 TaxID=2746727 RepID=UPI0025750959|nr:outer membrane beta-barrel protein [Sphingobacterium sp. N143]MDM1295979.1 outer membrane beta-barrel protein [Sphingobacterium sp. N143]
MRLAYSFFLLLVLSVLGPLARAQYKLTGTVTDVKDHAKLHQASVALLNPKDSILIKFDRTKENGQFQISNLDTGTYKMIVSYPQYADLVKDVQVEASDLDLGSISLAKAALLLDEVQVNGRIPVVIKGDTIEYDAGSFKVEKDAKVEDLLKVLPGITMDGSGKITAQGKEVKKVLLDGEEFFGDDPTLITKNIRSDMVSKVQVYEKKSDMAVRTGVDDGERTQTIDIKLKEDKKKGMFGQAVAGAGTDQYYGGKVMLNKFKGAQKIAAFGILANDGMVGLGFEDSQKYGVGGSSNIQMMDGGGIMISSNGDDADGGWDGKYNGGGVPKAINMGASYSDKSKDDKHKINVNYKRTQIDVANTSTYNAQNNLPERAQIDNNITRSENETKTNVANLRYDYKLDSLSDLTVNMGFSKSNRENASSSAADQRTLDGQLITRTNSNTDRNSDQDKFNINAMLTRRFKKERRSITFNVNANTDQNRSRTKYFSENYFNNSDSTALIDQYKNDKLGNNTYGASLTYTEPLSKKITGSIGYSFSSNSAETLNQSFDRDPTTGEYTVLDQRILNDFDFSSLKNGINASLNYKSSKLTVNLSNLTEFEDVKRTYNNLNTTLQRNQTSIRPAFSLNYKISKSRSLGVYYNGRTIQPSLTQIEPLKQNAQPLVEYLDNPDLKAGFNNSYSINYNAYKQLKDQNIYVYLSANQGKKNINSSIRYNLQEGTQQISFVNIDKDNWRIYGGSGYSFVLQKKWGLKMNLGMEGQYNSQYSYLSLVNEEPQLNRNQTWNIAPNIGFNRYKANKMDFYVSLRPGVEQMNSYLQPELNQTTFKFNSYSQFTYYLPKDFKISLSMQQNYQAATKTLQSINVVNMNGYISKKFLKDKSLEAQLFVNDILNKNNGIYRYQNGTSFIQTSNDVLRRYGMLKVIYNFTTMNR